MKCVSKDIKELLPLYLEQALEQSEREKVEKHLESCADCRTELGLLRNMMEEPVPDPGEAFWTRMPSSIYQAVQEQQSRPLRSGLSGLWQNLSVPSWAWAAAGVMVVAVLSWMLVRPAHKDVSVAVLPANEAPYEYEEVLASESTEGLDVASLTGDEVESMGAWAEKELAAMTAGAGEVMANGSDADMYEELAELDGKALERLSTMIDRLRREG
jgi:anti-sigma factor RsiW